MQKKLLLVLVSLLESSLSSGGAAVERAFIDPVGLPSRPWYRHIIYAPGFYSGYEAEVFLGLQEAIDEREAARARSAVRQAAIALWRARDALFLPATP